MALDVGDARIGIALSDEGGMMAFPHGVVYRKEGNPAERITELAKRENIAVLIVGLPKNMDGTVGPQARKAQTFAQTIAVLEPDLNIIFWDERLTTVQALNLRRDSGAGKKKRSTPIDAAAAAVLLQSYLDNCRHKDNG